MTEPHARFDGAIPRIYDEHLGPLFFEVYGRELAARVACPMPGTVLELACGTGIATEHLRQALADGCEIVATDVNPAMLQHARKRRGHLPGVRFEHADAMELPFEANAFDAVVSQFGVMFVPDRVCCMREVARVLKPGAAFTFSTWESLARNEIAGIAQRTIARFFASDPPTFRATPFGYFDQNRIRADLAAAGFTQVNIDPVTATVERPSARHVATGLVEGNPGVHEIRERASASPEEVADAVADALLEAFGDGPMRADLAALVVCALP